MGSGLISGEETINEAMKIIKIFEGYRSKAYKCQGGIWTVGWGRIGTDVREGTISEMSKEQEWLEARLEKDLVWLRNKLQPLVLESHQEAALLSLVYNIGTGNFIKSGVFRYLRNVENGMKLPLKLMEASWKSWVRAGGKVSKGLVNRRNAEWDLFSQHQL
jgi:lysozyme